MTKLTVFIVGEAKTGKTTISNYLAGMAESLNSTEYHPTQGVRILEFERQIIADPKKTKKWSKETIDGKASLIPVELWDCGGNNTNQSLIASFANEASGVIFTVNSESKNENELNEWQEVFTELKPSQASIFANKIANIASKSKYKTANKVLCKSPIVYTSVDQDPMTIDKEFNAFLASSYTSFLETKLLEENAILH